MCQCDTVPCLGDVGINTERVLCDSIMNAQVILYVGEGVSLDQVGHIAPVSDLATAVLLAYLGVEGSAYAHALPPLLWPDVPECDALARLARLCVPLTESTPPIIRVQAQLLSLSPHVEMRVGIADETLDATPANENAPCLFSKLSLCGEIATWATAVHHRYARRARLEFADLSHRAELEGDLPQALIYAKRALALEHRCEDCIRRVMGLIARLDGPAAAVALFARSNVQTHARYGVPLSSDLHRYARQLAVQTPQVCTSLR